MRIGSHASKHSAHGRRHPIWLRRSQTKRRRVSYVLFPDAMGMLITTARRALGAVLVVGAAGFYARDDVRASIRVDSIAVEAVKPTAPLEPELDSAMAASERADKLGRIFGDCGVLSPDVVAGAVPVERVQVLDLPGRVAIDDLDRLAPGALTLFTEMTRGGSVYAEAMSFDMLARCTRANLLKTSSMLSVRDEAGPRVDFLASIAGHKVGVAVARAYDFPTDEAASASAASTLVQQRLAALDASGANVNVTDQWAKSLLFVLADSKPAAAAIGRRWSQLSESVRERTMLWVAVTRGGDDGSCTASRSVFDRCRQPYRRQGVIWPSGAKALLDCPVSLFDRSKLVFDLRAGVGVGDRDAAERAFGLLTHGLSSSSRGTPAPR